MAKDANAFLSDVIGSIAIIQNHLVEVKSLNEYENNFLTTDAVERRLAIIGEALAKASKLNPEITVSHQKKIIALRHIIVHDYDLVDSNAIWAIVKVYLPVLKEEISKYLD
ncbi:MAG: HepT-like ribonuclease domain-containing protein [Ginsengibacter sp.]